MSTDNDHILIRIPRAHWLQIVSDIENMCGVSAGEIEILNHAEHERRYHHYHPCSNGECWDQRGH